MTHPPWRQGFHSAIDALIYALSVYGVPAAIGVVTLVALLAWDSQHDDRDSRPLAIAVLEERGAALTPAQAAERLSGAPAVLHHDTRLSEAPFWFAIGGAERAGGGEIELPSRHALQVACWHARTLEPIGHASRSAESGALRAIKSGFAIRLWEAEVRPPLLCRGSFTGPARISALQWPAGQLAASAQEYHRNAGLLEGGLL
ncbi:MAG TPA: diguanylate cyclase, partial [Burkholderiales bacterium]|nr:diguanylate cyclase [Burkholderiales bacterium]